MSPPVLSDVNWIWATFLKNCSILNELLEISQKEIKKKYDRRCSKIYLTPRCGLKSKTGSVSLFQYFHSQHISAHNILVILQLFWNVHFLFHLFHFLRSQQGFLGEIWEAGTLIGYTGQYLLWTAPQLTCTSSWLLFTKQGTFSLTQVCNYTWTAFNYTLIISKWRTICRHDHINLVAK